MSKNMLRMPTSRGTHNFEIDLNKLGLKYFNIPSKGLCGGIFERLGSLGTTFPESEIS